MTLITLTQRLKKTTSFIVSSNRKNCLKCGIRIFTLGKMRVILRHKLMTHNK